MDKKKTILIVSVVIIVFIGFILTLMFGVYKAEVYPNGDKSLVIRKIQNKNIVLNFLKPKASRILQNGDLILHKNPLIFDESFKEKTNYCSRIIGLPGDIITIRESQVFVNDKAIDTDYDIWFMFRVSSEKSINFQQILEFYNCEYLQLLNNGKACNIITTTDEAEKISKIDGIVNVRKIVEIPEMNSPEMFCSKGNYFLWNKDNLGPVAVPEQGVTVFFNPRNIGLYKYLIELHESNKLVFDINKVQVNDQETDSYLIKQNYYFVLNDNRFNRKDSRVWGFIPENQIIGKVINM